MINLDEYEQDILESVERGEWKSKNDIDGRLEQLQSYIKNQKKKDLENSIQILTHQFVHS